MRMFSIFGILIALSFGTVAPVCGQTTGGNSRVPPAPSMFGPKAAGAKRGAPQPRTGAAGVPEESKRAEAGKKKPPVTTITVELLTGSSGVGLKARQWAEVLSKLDVVVTVRNGRSDDKVGVTESKTGGTLRNVVVVGALDSAGRLIFPDQIFTEDD